MTDDSEVRWLTVLRGGEPLVVSMPHAGTKIVAEIENGLMSESLARKDADWWIDKLYDFAAGLGASVIVWTVDDPADLKRFVSWSVEGICTNHPERARPVVDAFRAA